ncbi:MAG: hypothetical protein QOH42_705 [Blastocatellia bacterium]|nr:hypothetical protein [Blastocatellia bacterium]
MIKSSLLVARIFERPSIDESKVRHVPSEPANYSTVNWIVLSSAPLISTATSYVPLGQALGRVK